LKVDNNFAKAVPIANQFTEIVMGPAQEEECMRLEAKFDREMVWYRGGSVRYLAIRVTAPAVGEQRHRAALNLALVVDGSGSMAGEPVQFAIDAAQRVVESLNEEDLLSVVSFASSVTNHLVREKMSEAGRLIARQALQAIRTHGSTNLSGGWLHGAEHVAVEMEEGENRFQNRVIVLSDGHANIGIVEPAKLAQHAKQLALRGLYSSTVGIGDDYHGETLEAIAVKGGGAHHRAARPQEIVEVVTAELDEIRLTEAENVQIVLRHTAGLAVDSLNEFPLSRLAEGSICDIGSLAAGASRLAVFAIKFPSGEPGVTYPIEVGLNWRRPGSSDMQSAAPIKVSAQFANGSDNNTQPYDAALTDEVAQMWQAKIVRRIVRLNREGRHGEALKRLSLDIPRLARYAERAANGSSLVAELHRLQEAADKDLHEGRRKEIEIAMHKRAYSKRDSRSGQLENWSDNLPDR
jgi:Ca-activated chloride channel family protein